MPNLRKLRHTISILYCLGMARTFGVYQHSGWNGEYHFAKYEWRGNVWVIPTSPVNGDTWH